MVGRTYTFSFSFTPEIYQEYLSWYTKNHVANCPHWFEVMPSSLGNFISAVADIPTEEGIKRIRLDLEVP